MHHVMMRGIERRALFHDDLDRARYLFRLERALLPAGTACFAWALMPNHVHLLLRTGPVPLSVPMHLLGTTYAMDFNTRHGRAGHLFQNRYKALPVEFDAYLLDSVRYIHLNPVRAGLVGTLQALEAWPWTGHRSLMGWGRCAFLGVDTVLRNFGPDPESARRALGEWMAAGLPSRGPDAEAIPRKGVPGEAGPEERCVEPGQEFQAIPDPRDRSPRWVRANALRQEGWDLERLTRWVCGMKGVSEAEVAAGRRRRPVSEARAIIAWLAWSDLALPQSALARHLGVGESALSRRMRTGRNLAERLGLDPFGGVLGDRASLRALHRELSTTCVSAT